MQKKVTSLPYQETTDQITLSEWFQIWFWDYKANLVKQSTLQTYQAIYKNQIEPFLGDWKLSQIKAYHIQKLYNRIMETNISTKYLRDIHHILHNMFDTAIINDFISKNPCIGVVMPSVTHKERRVLSVEEQQQLLRIVSQPKWKQYEPIIIIMLGTGMRVGELFALTWQDIDFGHKQIHINHTLVYLRNTENDQYEFSFQTPKTYNAIRTIPMQHNVEEAFRQQWTLQQKQKQDPRWEPLAGFEHLVFSNKYGRPRQRGALQKTLNRLVKAINQEKASSPHRTKQPPMKPIHPHTLRHTFATRCFEAEIPPKTVQMILGHSNIQITLDLYTHVSNKKKSSDLRLLEKVFRDIY